MNTEQRTMKALVVDDSRAARSILRNALKERGFSVTEAADGEEALDRMKSGELPDIALVDWNMPVMNGLEFIKALRAEDAWSDVTVLMVTSEVETRQLVRALNAGANEYLMKPFTKDLLFQKLDLLGFIER